MQQCMKLTGTNRSFDLDRSHCSCSSRPANARKRLQAAMMPWVVPTLWRLRRTAKDRPRHQARGAQRLASPKSPPPPPYQRRVQNQRLPTADWRIPSLIALRYRISQIQLLTLAFSRPGGHRGVPPPVPIPNTAVKRPSAYGTSSQDAGESVAARSAKRKSSNRLITNPQTNPIPRGGAAR